MQKMLQQTTANATVIKNYHCHSFVQIQKKKNCKIVFSFFILMCAFCYTCCEKEKLIENSI